MTTDGRAWAVVIALAVAAVLTIGLAVVRTPSSTEVSVGHALQTGELVPGLSIALVDTEAARRMRQARFVPLFLAASALVLVAGAVLVVARGLEVTRAIVWVAWSSAFVLAGWSMLTSTREARRWESSASSRWSSWAQVQGEQQR